MTTSTKDGLQTVDPEDVRVSIYGTFARSGRPPSPTELADEFGIPTAQIHSILQELAAAHHVVLDENGGVKMAHPFSAIPLGFSVMGDCTLYWGGCAWDSFALVHLIPWEKDMLVATRCPACSTPHAWNINRNSPPPAADQVAHFLTPSDRMWDDIVTTCRHQSIFCSEDCVDAWLEETGNVRGYVMDLTTLWNFASDCTDRLDHGYTRRPPAEAAEHLRSLGISGPFWGL